MIELEKEILAMLSDCKRHDVNELWSEIDAPYLYINRACNNLADKQYIRRIYRPWQTTIFRITLKGVIKYRKGLL